MIKKFSQALHDKYDTPAKNVVASFLSVNGGYTVNEGSKYDIDLIAHRGNEKNLVEVEVKTSWTTDYFPYSTVHLLYRKKKFFNRPERVFFVLLNNQMTHGMIIHSKRIINADIIIKDNIHVKGEKFYEIAVDDCPITKLV